MKRIAVFPGSFDPITVGHLDLIHRASEMFDELIVAVLINPSKKGCFEVDERLELLQKACADIPNVRFDSFYGLLVDYMRKVNAQVVVRGVRTVADLENETQMAILNRTMEPSMDTVFLPADAQNSAISSSAVREIASFGGDISPFVPECIVDDIMRHFNKENRV